MLALSPNFAIFTFCGVWRPFSWFSGWKFGLYNFYSFVMIVLVCTFVVSESIELFASFDSVEEFALGSFVLLTMIGVFTKMVILLRKRQEIIDLTDALGSEICEPRDPLEIKIQSDGHVDARWIFSRYATLTLSTALLMLSKSIILDTPERKLTFKAWLPYAYDSTEILFLVTFIHQFIAASTGAILNSAFDTFFPGLIILTCCQMKILKYRIEAIPKMVENRLAESNGDDGQDYETKKQVLESNLLADCIRHHIRIFQLAGTLNSIFGFVIFLQFSISSLVLCVSVYEVSKVKLFTAEFVATVMYLASMLMQIFILCFYGNELSLQSIDVCHAVYKMDWTPFRTKTKKSLIMMILRSQRPITFICYHVITLSLDAFARLIKLSYSVFNVISSDD